MRLAAMPEKQTLDRARADKRAGKSASTQAGEFIREQIDHIREGRHGARSTKQAIAIGLSEARRSGVDLPPPRSGTVSAQTQTKARRDSAKGHGVISSGKVNATRSRATEHALEREGSAAASPRALSRQARTAAAHRSPAARSASARKAAATRASHRR
jgi:hypothetical protein